MGTTRIEYYNHREKKYLTTMEMVPTAGAGAMMGVVSGGILGGALHAIAGESF